MREKRPDAAPLYSGAQRTNWYTEYMSKRDLLAVLTEASRKGDVSAIFILMAQLKGLDAPTDEVMGAIKLGQSKAALGL